MEFKSQICTTREQSEKLLAAGLKKETADVLYRYVAPLGGYVALMYDWNENIANGECIPAWSLHRLIEISDVDRFGFLRYTSWDDIVGWLCGLIEKGAINSEYLNKKV